MMYSNKKLIITKKKRAKAHGFARFPFIGILNWEVRLFPFGIASSVLDRRLADIHNLEIV